MHCKQSLPPSLHDNSSLPSFYPLISILSLPLHPSSPAFYPYLLSTFLLIPPYFLPLRTLLPPFPSIISSCPYQVPPFPSILPSILYLPSLLLLQPAIPCSQVPFSLPIHPSIKSLPTYLPSHQSFHPFSSYLPSLPPSFHPLLTCSFLLSSSFLPI